MAMLKMRFRSEEDEQLIELVKKHPVLYDPKDLMFKNTMKRDLVWEEAAKALNRTVAECKNRWKSIRDHYRKDQKGGDKCSSRPPIKKKRAFYWTMLDFLDQVEDEKCGSSNISSETISEEQDMSNEETDYDASEGGSTQQSVGFSSYLFQTPNKGIERIEHEKDYSDGNSGTAVISQPEENETDLFFRTLAVTLKRFRPDLMTQTKAKIFQLVSEMELLNLKSNSSISVSKSKATSDATTSEVKEEIVEENHFLDPNLEATTSCPEDATIVKTEPDLADIPDMEDETMPLESHHNSTGENQDACSFFGKYVAAELRSLPVNQRVLVQQEIQGCITNAVLRSITPSDNTETKPNVSSSAGPSNV